MIDPSSLNMTLDGLQAHYREKDFSPEELIDYLLAVCGQADQNPVWIYRLSREELAPYLEALANLSPEDLPLYGVPFAIKDNIDLAAIPTTAACADYQYTPEKSAFVVEQLLAAGAIPLGKSNMDQFATGLVGTRSPWGACQNALNSEYIAGGSSSGSAVAVAKGWVSFALGTDTAGSGRVPAALNNLVGLKPSRGLVSTRGVVPACRSLDCVSILALSTADANRVFDVAAKFDPEDDYARPNTYANGPRYFNSGSGPFRVGVPRREQREFFGNSEAEILFDRALSLLEQSGAELVEIDFSPFAEAAQLLYRGPWVAERLAVAAELLDRSPDSVLPVIRRVLETGGDYSAGDTFAALHHLQHLKQLANRQLSRVDSIATPTVGTHYRIQDIATDPVGLNTNLGYYTNFMNLLDCAAVALPTGFFESGVGFGLTLYQDAFTDKQLLSLAAQVEGRAALPRGATATPYRAAAVEGRRPASTVNLVVCGAHMTGLALNWQLTERGGELREATQTAPAYRLYALAGGPPARPGLIRDTAAGFPIDVEVWTLPLTNFGSFVAEIPPPLGIGRVELADGRWESGFICEPYGLESAREITQLGGWRPYLALSP